MHARAPVIALEPCKAVGAQRGYHLAESFLGLGLTACDPLAGVPHQIRGSPGERRSSLDVALKRCLQRLLIWVATRGHGSPRSSPA